MRGKLHKVGLQLILMFAFAYVTRADGKISPEELSAIVNFFQNMDFNAIPLGQTKDILTAITHQTLNIDAIIRNYKTIAADKPSSYLIKNATLIAAADGNLSRDEKNALAVIYKKLK